jgi:hypothetical protein
MFIILGADRKTNDYGHTGGSNYLISALAKVKISSTSYHLLDCLHKHMKTYNNKLHAQMVLLMMNT